MADSLAVKAHAMGRLAAHEYIDFGRERPTLISAPVTLTRIIKGDPLVSTEETDTVAREWLRGVDEVYEEWGSEVSHGR